MARSLLNLHLPADYHWFNFGDKMSPLTGEEEAAKYRVAIDTEQAKRLLETVRHGAKFAQARAANALSVFSQNRYTGGTTISLGDLGVQQEAQQQEGIVREASQEIQRQETASQTAAVVDNRQKLNDAYNGQRNGGVLNVVQGLGSNFTAAALPQVRVQNGEGRFNEDWFEGNKLGVNKDTGIAQADASGLIQNRLVLPQMRKYAAQGNKKAEMQWDFKVAANKGQTPSSSAGDRQMAANQPQMPSRENVTVQRYKQKLGQPIATNQPEAPGPPPPAVQPPAQPTGLASLDVEIPLRGTTFYFTAPHGDVEMDARAVSEKSIGRAARSLWGLLGLGLLALALRYTRRKERQV